MLMSQLAVFNLIILFYFFTDKEKDISLPENGPPELSMINKCRLLYEENKCSDLKKIQNWCFF